MKFFGMPVMHIIVLVGVALLAEAASKQISVAINQPKYLY